MKYINYYKQTFELFLTKAPTDNLIIDYYLGNDEMLQFFVNRHIRRDFNWCTGIAIIEAVEKIVQESIYNGNIKDN